MLRKELQQLQTRLSSYANHQLPSGIKSVLLCLEREMALYHQHQEHRNSPPLQTGSFERNFTRHFESLLNARTSNKHANNWVEFQKLTDLLATFLEAEFGEHSINNCIAECAQLGLSLARSESPNLALNQIDNALIISQNIKFTLYISDTLDDAIEIFHHMTNKLKHEFAVASYVVQKENQFPLAMVDHIYECFIIAESAYEQRIKRSQFFAQPVPQHLHRETLRELDESTNTPTL